MRSIAIHAASEFHPFNDPQSDWINAVPNSKDNSLMLVFERDTILCTFGSEDMSDSDFIIPIKSPRN
jgi:hypothetical protein